MKLIARHQCFRCNQQHEKEVAQQIDHPHEVALPPGWCEFSLGATNIGGELCVRCKDEVGQTLRGTTKLLFKRYRHSGDAWTDSNGDEWMEVPKAVEVEAPEHADDCQCINCAPLRNGR